MKRIFLIALAAMAMSVAPVAPASAGDPPCVRIDLADGLNPGACTVNGGSGWICVDYHDQSTCNYWQ